MDAIERGRQLVESGDVPRLDGPVRNYDAMCVITYYNHMEDLAKGIAKDACTNTEDGRSNCAQPRNE